MTENIDASEIPRIIHQIWLGPLEPPMEAMETWRQLHPDWEYILWTEENLPALKNQDAFDRSKSYAQKADILRYELLHCFGGIFVDADEYCVKELTPLYRQVQQNNCDCFAVFESEKSNLIANGILACTAKNSFMAKMVDEINIDRQGDPWQLVGPKYLTDMVETHSPNIHIFKSKVFIPFHFSDRNLRFIDIEKVRQDPEIYGVQLWGSTTSAYKPKFRDAPRLYVRHYINKLKGKTFRIT